MESSMQSRTVVISTSMVAWLIVGTCVRAQTAKSTTGTLHERKGVQPISEPPAVLRQITVELSGSLVGQSPNRAIEFVLTLQNTGHQEVKIQDPLDSLFLRFATIGDKLITVPERLPKAVLNIGGGKTNIPLPSAINIRPNVQGKFLPCQKKEGKTNSAG